VQAEQRLSALQIFLPAVYFSYYPEMIFHSDFIIQ